MEILYDTKGAWEQIRRLRCQPTVFLVGLVGDSEGLREVDRADGEALVTKYRVNSWEVIVKEGVLVGDSSRRLRDGFAVRKEPWPPRSRTTNWIWKSLSAMVTRSSLRGSFPHDSLPANILWGTAVVQETTWR
jgi:hypothetical protein